MYDKGVELTEQQGRWVLRPVWRAWNGHRAEVGLSLDTTLSMCMTLGMCSKLKYVRYYTVKFPDPNKRAGEPD